MAQTTASVPTKSTGDNLTADNVNAIVAALNANSGDAEARMAALEALGLPAAVAKLADVEAGATADQTGAEIATALDGALGGQGWRTHAPLEIVDVTASRAVLTTDIYKFLRFTNATAAVFTISTGIMTPGQYTSVLAYGAGGLTLAAGAGVTLDAVGGALVLDGQFAVASVYCVAVDTFVAVGKLTT